MSMQLPYPNLTAREPGQQLQEVKEYLYRLVDQLNFALSQLERGENNARG